MLLLPEHHPEIVTPHNLHRLTLSSFRTTPCPLPFTPAAKQLVKEPPCTRIRVHDMEQTRTVVATQQAGQTLRLLRTHGCSWAAGKVHRTARHRYQTPAEALCYIQNNPPVCCYDRQAQPFRHGHAAGPPSGSTGISLLSAKRSTILLLLFSLKIEAWRERLDQHSSWLLASTMTETERG